jgi:hypothetical protein
MTKLSWLLWLSDVVYGVQSLCGVTLAIGGVGAVIATACMVLAKDEMDGTLYGRLSYAVRRLWAILAVAAVLVVAIPSKTTVLAIAATETAAMAMQTPDGREITSDALNAVKAWLRAQIVEEKKK